MTQFEKSKEFNLSNENIVLKAYRNGKVLDSFELKDFETMYMNLHYDKLTLLGNRELLRKDLNNKVEKYLIYLDIKDFGYVNEAFGEDIGNMVLLNIAQKLKSYFFDFDIYRAGGDIFALLLKQDFKKIDHNNIENRIKMFFLQPIVVQNEDINLLPTVALVEGINNILNKAEATLREAKQNNKNFLVYDKEFAIQRKNRYDGIKVTMNKIIVAIREDKIFPVFQPIYSNTEDKIVKYEALARLRADDREFTPYEFIEIAKKNNQYADITKSIIKKSLHIFNNNDLGISINLSISDITNIDIVDFIISQINGFRNPKRISFEILEDESIVLLDTNKTNIAVNKFFNAVNHFGCSIAIDDFGAGYSNFINILKLKPQIIKIDGSIISKLDEMEVRIIVELLVEYSKKIGCDIIAEYVSDRQVQNTVKSLGIKYSQGYFIGKPTRDII